MSSRRSAAILLATVEVLTSFYNGFTQVLTTNHLLPVYGVDYQITTQSACLSQGQAYQLLDRASFRTSVFPFRWTDV
jgi:hypothetical protein